MLLATVLGCGAASRTVEPTRPEHAPEAAAQPMMALAQSEQQLEQALAAPETADCERICLLRDDICELSERICTIADRNEAHPDLAGQCREAGESCTNANRRAEHACGCPRRHR